MIQFSADELQTIKELRDKYHTVIFELGQIQIEKKMLSNKEDSVNSKYESIRATEKSIIDRLIAKYGQGILDLEKGTFAPNTK